MLSVQSPMWGLNPQAMRPRPEPKSLMLNQLNHPRTLETFSIIVTTHRFVQRLAHVSVIYSYKGRIKYFILFYFYTHIIDV